MLIYIYLCVVRTIERGFFLPKRNSLPFYTLKKYCLYVRLTPFINRLLWAVYTQIQADTRQAHFHTHTFKALRRRIFRVIENFFVSHTAFLYVKCIMALCNLLWLIITRERFYCTLLYSALTTINNYGQSANLFFLFDLSILGLDWQIVILR